LLIVIVVGLAIGITIQRANSIARTTVNNSISGASKLFRELERQRLQSLASIAQLVGGDPSFYAYIQTNLQPQSTPAPVAAPQPGAPAAAPVPPATTEPTVPTPDLVSIVDQLTQRRDSWGSDLLILLDDQGRLVARTDQPATTAVKPEDFYEESPLVKKIVDDASLTSTAGVIVTNGKLFHAAVVPIASGANSVRVGYLINANAIDDNFANRIAE